MLPWSVDSWVTVMLVCDSNLLVVTFVLINSWFTQTIGALAFFFAFFGEGTGSIWLDNVGCTGRERRLADCPANPIGSHNCLHFEDASVRCQPLVTTTPIG